MRKLGLIAILTLSFGIFGCSNIQGNHPDKKPDISEVKDNNKTDEVKPEYLTFETFKEKVWNFEENPHEWVYEGEEPCVIDFYADWCKPCRMVAPIMDELSKEYEGKVKIYKIDTDKEKQLAGVFGIKSIPTVLFVPKEGRPAKQAGALPKSEYVRIIEEVILKNKQQ